MPTIYTQEENYEPQIISDCAYGPDGIARQSRGTAANLSEKSGKESVLAIPLGTVFTYQCRLRDSGAPANGVYDFRFILYDAASGGNQVGSEVYNDDISVSDGLFTVNLDFGGSVFTGEARMI
jgi:hypothetical protein